MSNVVINPRYLSFDKDEVQQILSSVQQIDNVPRQGSNYPVSSSAVAAVLAGYTTTEELEQMLKGKQDSTPVAEESEVRSIVTSYGEN